MQRLEIIETLKQLTSRLVSEINGLPDAATRFRPSPQEWSIRDTVAHLWLADDIWFKRLNMVCSLHDPVLVAFAGEEEARERANQAVDLGPLITELAARRLKIVDLLSAAVDWTRTGQWPGEGRRSLMQLAEHLVQHDADHLAQIRSLKAAHRVNAG